MAAIVPLLVFTLAYQYTEYRDDIRAADAQTLTFARSLSLLVEEELQARIEALQALATSSSLQSGSLDRFRARADMMARDQFPGAIIELLQEDGTEVMSTALPPGAPAARRSNLDSLRQVFQTQQPAVSNLFESATGHRPVVAIDVPVKDDTGKIISVLSLHPKLELFGDLIRRQHLSDSWGISVFDRNGIIIAHLPDSDKLVGLPASNNFFPVLQAASEGNASIVSRNGVPVITGFSHGERYGWAVGIGVPRAELIGPVVAGAIKTLAVGGVLLIAGLGLAVYAAHRIAGPINSLRRLAAASDGHPIEPSRTGLPEVDEVALALYAAEVDRQRSREAEQLLLASIESIPEGFAVFDAEDRLTMCNESYRQLFPGKPEHVVPGARFADMLRASVVPCDDAQAQAQSEDWIAARVKEHSDLGAAIEQMTRDERWVLVRNRGTSHGGVASLRIDITALKAAEAAFRESEDRFRRVVEAVPNAILMVSQNGTMELVNEQAERIFGWSRSELLGQAIEMLLPERLRRVHPGLRDAFFAAPSARSMGIGRDLYGVRKGGEEFPIEVGLSPIQTEAGTMVLASITDITERKAAEQALRASEKQLREAQRLAQMGSFVWDLQNDKVEWSDQTYQIFGVARDSYELTRDSVIRLIHPDDRATVLAATEAAASGTAPPSYEYRIVRPDGSIRVVYRESELVRDEARNPRFFAGIFQDVTERRQTEAQLRQSQKMEAIGNLTGGMAHDFNNLLGVIVGNLDLVREHLGDDEDVREMVGEAFDAAWRGADLTRRLLAFARRQPLRPERIEVNELVGDAVRLLRRLLGEDIEVSLNLGTDLWPVSADPAQLEAALANLATNARDAMPHGGRLIIATDNRVLDADYAASHAEITPGDFVMIEVSDTGIGMSAETMSQIFEPFFTTKEAGRGTGLGLSMVFGFLKQSGGHINVYSEAGRGTTFRLYLPRATIEAMAREVEEAEGIARGAGETVLVVEDNPGMRRVALRQLRDLGYRVLECERAAAALEILMEQPVDLLLTDIVMPGGMDGVELVQLAQQRWPDLKIVLTSGFPQARVDDNGGLLGKLCLLSKPYRKEELAAALRAALDG